MFKSEKASIKKRISKSIQILEEISFSKDTISIKPEKTTNKRKIKHHSSRPAKRASMISSDHEVSIYIYICMYIYVCVCIYMWAITTENRHIILKPFRRKNYINIIIIHKKKNYC